MDIKPFNESFGLALEARRRDFKVLYDCNKMSNDHECLLMHFGGIVVECFLKDLIVNRYGIAYKRDKYWYSSKAHSKLIVDPSDYKKHSQLFEKYNANQLLVAWSTLGKESVVEEINFVMEEMVDGLNGETLNRIYEGLIAKEVDDSLFKLFGADAMWLSGIEREKIRDFIFGKRINPDQFTKEIALWLYEELSKQEHLSKGYVITLLKKPLIFNWKKKLRVQRVW